MGPALIILCSVIGLTSGVGLLPDSVNGAVGDKMILYPSEIPTLLIKWSFGDVTILTPNYINPKYEGRVRLIPTIQGLELNNLSLSDAGNYSITIEVGGQNKSGLSTLNMYEPVSDVKITESSTELVEFNDTLTLSCSASGSALSFVWFNNSAEIKASDRVNFSDGGANVTINPVLRYDDTFYTCKVSNPVSSRFNEKSLSISYGPDFAIMKTTDEHYLSGSDAFMICQSYSRPSSQYSWFFNEIKLSYTGSSVDLVNIQTNQTGNYSCEAFNNRTLRYVRSTPVPISVWVRIEKPSVKPSSEPVKGSSVNLTCDASGSILTREWIMNDVEIKPSGNIEFYDEKRVLSLKTLTSKDNGLYTCKISNPASSASSFYRIDIPNNALSAGAIAGITIATVVVVAGAAAGGFYLYKRK